MKQKTAKRLMIVLGLVVGIFLASVVTVYAVIHYGFINQMEFDRTSGTRPIETNLEELDVDESFKAGFAIPVQERDPKVRNFLLIGSDRRYEGEHGRSDAMMIVTLNEKTKKIHITSLMRAIYVSIPNEPDPGYEAYLSTEYMLNAAHTWGGPRLLMRTIERNFRIVLDGYFQIDFSGFETAIDTVGGVVIDLTDAEAAYLNNLHPGAGLYGGPCLLYGELALEYSRIRALDSDFVRTGRQRQVIESLLGKALRSGASDLIEVAQTLLPLVTTDISSSDIMGLLLGATSYRNYEIEQLMIPIEGTAEMIYVSGMEMYQIDFVKNIEALHSFMDG